MATAGAEDQSWRYVGSEPTVPDDEEEHESAVLGHWRKAKKSNVKAVVILQQLDRENNCHRCGKKVYPVEKLDVGVLYHRVCFKCVICARQLTLQNFQREIDLNNSQIKEVYCNSHVPRQGHGVFDQDALGIRSAMDAQRHANRKVNRRQVNRDHNFIPDYPHRASNHLSSNSSGDDASPRNSDEWETRTQETTSSLVVEVTDRSHDVHSETSTDVNHRDELQKEPAEVSDEENVFDEEEEAEGNEQDGAEENEESSRSVLLRRQESASQKNTTIRRRSTLRSFQDFQKFGVFDAQNLMEKAQRQEEDELYSQIEAERRSLRTRLDEALRSERDASVRDLVKFFETNAVPTTEQQEALVKVEEYYRKRREAALRELLTRLAAEEQAAVARMVEKHSNEMIQLIRKREPNGTVENERIAEQTLGRAATNRLKPEPHESTATDPPPGGNSNRTEHKSARVGNGAASINLTITGNDTGTGNVDSVSAVTSTASGFPPPSRVNRSSTARPVMRITPLIQRASSPTPDHEPPSLSSLAIRGGDVDANTNDTNFNTLSTIHGGTLPGKKVETEVVKDDALNHDDDDDFEASSALELSQAVPEAEPPSSRKGTLYTDPDVFREQDRRAIAESKKDHKTFTDLVRQLSHGCQTELQKVRSIFRWLTVKDLNRMKFAKRLDPNSPLALLRGIKIGTESYHDLFRRLCGYAGLHCEIIEGYSKGSGYHPADLIKGDLFRNQWTAVWVDGSWRFINCKWGARHVTATRDTTLTYKCDEFYFLTDPEDHIYQHFPKDPLWQLLPEPIRMSDFIRLPVLKSPFFNNGLSLACPYNAILQAEDGQAEVRLTSAKLLCVVAKLESTNPDIPTEILVERTLVRYKEDEFVVMLNLPSPGTYYLNVFAASEWDSTRMDNVCSFQVRCTGISRNAHVTYPPIGCFGPTPSFIACGLSTETQKDPYIITNRGHLTVTYKLTKNVSLKATLRRWDSRGGTMADYDRYNLFRQRTSHVATFELQLPRRGLYVFSIYVVNPDDSGSSGMLCLYRYLIDCTAPNMDALPYPKASKRFKHCRVIEPLTGDLQPETEVTFAFESRHAVEMLVLFNDKSHNLKANGKLWTNTVYINVPTGKVMVYARFDPASDKCIPMLEYQIAKTSNKV